MKERVAVDTSDDTHLADFVPQPPPRRIARDGKAYTEEYFQQWYGVACSKIWDAAIPESSVAKPAPDHVPDLAPALDPVPARVTVPPQQASSSVAKSATALAPTQAATIQGGPTAEQVARVSAIMGEYRTGNWLDEHERWKRDCALESLENYWHRHEQTESLVWKVCEQCGVSKRMLDRAALVCMLCQMRTWRSAQASSSP